MGWLPGGGAGEGGPDAEGELGECWDSSGGTRLGDCGLGRGVIEGQGNGQREGWVRLRG